MKNLTKTILIIILSYLASLQPALGQSDFAIFDTQISLDHPPFWEEIPSGYPASIGSSSLKRSSSTGLGADDLTEIYGVVSEILNIGEQPVGNPVMGAFFTTEETENTQEITRGKTHGLCFAFHNENILTLYYFEANGNGSYDWVENLTTSICSITDELLISMQYCQFSPGTFPDKSTLFSFVCDSVGTISDPCDSDFSIRLSKDHKRQTGLFSIGMADSTILSSCERPNSEVSNCGGACLMTAPNSNCAMVLNTQGFVVYTCVSNNGGCAAGAIERRRREEDLDLGVPMEFKMMRDFRDEFMTQYCEGRKYTGYYYTFSKFAKMNVSMLWKYASILPEIYTAIENLTDETTDQVVITHSLLEKVLEIVNEHQDSEDRYFQSILSDVVQDMEIFTGLTRSELISMLTPYGACGNERKSQTDEKTEKQFASAHHNRLKNEIVVNYLLPGNRFRIELFSAASGEILSTINASNTSRLLIPDAKLEPGIYIIRIISDSGDERSVKVAVLK